MDARKKGVTTGLTLSQVFNLNTKKIEPADYWLSQDIKTIMNLRYALREGSKKYVCPICKTPVLLRCGSQRAWHFAHRKLDADKNCPLVSDNEEKNRIQEYNYHKETDEHIFLKNFIANALYIMPIFVFL